MTPAEPPLPAATSRRELRERERAAAVMSAAPDASPPTVPTPAAAPHPAPSPSAPGAPRATSTPPRRPTARHKLGSRLLSLGALTAVGALVVGMSLPANVLGGYELAAADAPELAAAVDIEGQEVAIANTDASALGVARDNFEIKSWAQVLRDKYSRGNHSYSVFWTGPIRWPFPYEVPITDGFGPRPAPCAGCSTYHYAIDLVPGAGTPIYSIADGVVIDHVDGHGSWGNYVRIQHMIDGRTVISSYAHMQTGSSPLAIGDTIKVGEFVGLVGATGQVTAPHLHLEIEDNGVRVDPFVWLTQNTSR